MAARNGSILLRLSGIWTVCAVRVLLPSLSASANFVNVMATISVVSRPLRYMQVQMNTQYCPNPLNEAVNSTGAWPTYPVSFDSFPSHLGVSWEKPRWEGSTMRKSAGFEIAHTRSGQWHNIWQLCIFREGVWDGLSWAAKVLLLGQLTMASQEKHQNPYTIELPQSIIDSFSRFLVPEIQKFYASEQEQKELTT